MLKLFTSKIIIRHHAVQRYEERSFSQNYKNRSTRSCILNDLKPMNVMRIEKCTDEDNKYIVHCRGKREFVVLQEGDKVIVKTMIQKLRKNSKTSQLRELRGMKS